MTKDRFAVKYAPMTPYQYGANNPVRFIDVNGDSLDVYSPDGSHLFTMDDGKSEVSGYYLQNSSTDNDGNVSYSGGVAFGYNDAKEDRARALNGEFSFNVVTDQDIDSYTREGISGVSGFGGTYSQGRARGSLDYYGKENSPIGSNTLNIVNSARGGSLAYNPNDFGNYLTGFSLRRLGFSANTAIIGANLNNIINGPSDHGSRAASGWLDSASDKRAILNGYYHYNTSNPRPAQRFYDERE